MKNKVSLLSVKKGKKDMFEIIETLVFEFEIIRLCKIKGIKLSKKLFDDFIEDIEKVCGLTIKKNSQIKYTSTRTGNEFDVTLIENVEDDIIQIVREDKPTQIEGE